MRRLLLVEDEPGLVLTLTDRLARDGYAVENAADGESGLEIFDRMRDRIRLVLLDMAMPRLDGVETFRLLRERSASVPVVLASGFDESEARSRFNDSDLAEFLQKPFTSTELAAKVYAVCNGRE